MLARRRAFMPAQQSMAQERKAWFEDLLKQVGLYGSPLTGRVSCRVDSSSASP